MEPALSSTFLKFPHFFPASLQAKTAGISKKLMIRLVPSFRLKTKHLYISHLWEAGARSGPCNRSYWEAGIWGWLEDGSPPWRLLGPLNQTKGAFFCNLKYFFINRISYRILPLLRFYMDEFKFNGDSILLRLENKLEKELQDSGFELWNSCTIVTP